MTIWFFHSGIVVSTDAWIFSTRFWSLLWMRRICGAVWMAIMRVSLRSWMRRSNLVAACCRSAKRCAAMTSSLAATSASSAGILTACSSCSACSPAAMYTSSCLR